MKKLITNIGVGIIALIGLIALAAFISQQQSQNISDVSISDIYKEIKQGNVKKVVVENGTVTATIKDTGEKKRAEKESGGTFLAALKDYGVSESTLEDVTIDIQNNTVQRTLGQIGIRLIPILILVGILLFLLRRASKGGGGMQGMPFGKSQARMITPDKKNKKKLSFDNIAGLKEAKDELYEIVEFLSNPQKFNELGGKIPKGVLLVGPPGTGKTLLARAIANEAEVPFFYTSGSEFVEMFVGVGASRIRDLFKNAVQQSPALIFIDELDAIGRRRGGGMGGGNDEKEQTLNQILVEMDGFQPNSGLIVLAATNRPDVLDPALLRPGRFDRRIMIHVPDVEERRQILEIHAQNKPLEDDVDLKKVAERTPGFAGADIENLLNEAAILTARQGAKKITERNILDSIDKVLMGPERRSKVISDREKEIVAYHEAGHAIVFHYSEYADPVQKITIVSRGQAGGYTMKLPTEEKNLQTRSEFLASITGALGGYASEKVYFNEITNGSSNDIEKATETANQLIKKFGMSDELGPVHYKNSSGLSEEEPNMYSQKTLETIDSEVKNIMVHAYHEAESIIQHHPQELERLAKHLMYFETIEKPDFERIMNGEHLIPTEAETPSDDTDNTSDHSKSANEDSNS